MSSGLDAAVRALALALGFDLVGVAPAAPIAGGQRLRDWLARGYDGDMAYLGRRLDERLDPGRVLPGARSVLVVGLVYGEEPPPEPGGPSRRPAAPAPPGEGRGIGARGRVARYAGGDDYHEVLGERLRALEAGLPALAGAPVATRAYVDTGPVQERDLAAQAGLGWIGKNACLIHPGLGSWLLLGVLLSDLPLSPDEAIADHCGDCRACLDACPTDAFPEPGVLDATRCIAYTTIESPGPIPEPLRGAHGDRLFGCDVCQEVCPWNTRRLRRAPPDPLGLRARLAPRPEWARPALEALLELDEAGWRRSTRRSALRRSGHRGILRSALVAAGNAGDPALRAAVARHAEGADPMLAEHARWALERIPEP